MSKVPLYLYSKLASHKRTNEVVDYATAHDLEVIPIDRDNIYIKQNFYDITSRKDRRKMDAVVIYARFSSSNQNEISITGQLDECLAYCARRKKTVIAIYVDMALTGTNERRYAFQKLNADISEQKYNGCNIVVYKTNRFFRDTKRGSYYKCIYSAYGIDVESATQHYGEGKSAALMKNIDACMDEYFSVELSEAVKRGLKQRALQCRYTGGYVTYGYRINQETMLYEINEAEAEIVRLVFKMYTNKMGYTEILRELNRRGAVTRKGTPFAKNTLGDMLGNERYIGTYTYGVRTPKDESGSRNSHKYNDEESILKIPNGIPAIVDKDVFALAQKRKEANKHGTHSRREKEPYLLTGLLYCAECGHAFTGNVRYAGRNKTKYVTYRCTNHNKGEKCACKEVNRDYLESFVIDTIINRILIPERATDLLKEFRERQSKGDSEYHNRIRALQQEIAALEVQRRNILAAIDKGIATDDLLEHLQDKKHETERMKAKLIELENNAPKPINEREFHQLIEKAKQVIKHKSVDDLRRLISFYVSRIEVGKDDITVVLSFDTIVSLVGGGEGN